jgi:hypothetical protein
VGLTSFVPEARSGTVIRPRDQRNWYLLGTNQVNYGVLRLEQGGFAQSEEVLASADEPIQHALALDPHDAAMLEVRASQLMNMAKAADRSGSRVRAQQRMRPCLGVVSDMISWDPSAKDYIGDRKCWRFSLLREVNQLPICMPCFFTPLTRRMPAARFGLRSPQSTASYASLRIAARCRLIAEEA